MRKFVLLSASVIEMEGHEIKMWIYFYVRYPLHLDALQRASYQQHGHFSVITSTLTLYNLGFQENNTVIWLRLKNMN